MGVGHPAGPKGTRALRPTICLLALTLAAALPRLASADPHPAVLGGTAAYRTIARQEATRADLPPEVADAVMAIESSYDPGKVGGVGEIGLMQVRPGTAAMLGFRGTDAELARPETNIHFGVTYLARAWHLAGGDLCRALMKYRAGHGEEVMTPLSVTYCGRARAHLATVGSPLAGAVLPLATGPAGASRNRPRLLDQKARDAAFWAAHEARIRAISARIAHRWAMNRIALR